MENKKVLGLDLGSNSIGWAYINPANELKPIQAGVRLVPLKSNEGDEFSQGNAISTNAARTMARGARRNLDRYQQRRDKLIEIFKEQAWIKDISELKVSETHEIWALRSKAVDAPISLTELARVLVHLNKKRGFLSNRKDSSSEKELSDYKQAISDNDRMVLEQGLTIGQWYYSELEAVSPNQELPRFRNRVFSRQLHREEFERIWETQAAHHGLSEVLKKEIGEYGIFKQRPLKSQKGLLSKCFFFPKVRVIAESHPLFQMYRAWVEINNLQINLIRGNRKLSLDLNTKQEIFKRLEKTLKGKLTKKQLKEIIAAEIGQSPRSFNINSDGIKACTTKARIHQIKEKYHLSLETDFDPYKEGDSYDKQELLQLWHLLYSIPEESVIKRNLAERFQIEGEAAEELIGLPLSDQYGNLSSRAIRKILPGLEVGLMYSEACAEAGLRHSAFETTEEREQKILLDEIPLISKNELRSPVVEKVLNQMIHVVNAIISDPEFGRPDEIHVELARELTSNQKQRNQAHSRNKKAAANHDRIKEELKKFGLKRISRKDIEKYKLGEECNWVSIYTGKAIKPSEVFTTDMYDVEHIIPRSRFFDDSFQNKTLAERSFNERKGAETAYDYIATLGLHELEAYLDRVEELFKNRPAKGKISPKQVGWITKSKYEKLRMKGENIPDDFISRQLNETSYISKKALSILKSVSRVVLASSGSVSSEMRKQWKLEEVLKELNQPDYRENGLTSTFTTKDGHEKVRLEGWSKREDHRHHALDAIVTGLVNASIIQRLNNLNKLKTETEKLSETEDFHRARSLRKFDPPMPGLREKVKSALESIIISRKEGKKVATWSRNKVKKKGFKHKVDQGKQLVPRGELHKETVYARRLIELAEPVPLNKINKNHRIKDPELRATFISRLERYGNNSKKAFSAQALKKDPFIWEGKELREVLCWEYRYIKRTDVDKSLKVEEVVNPELRKILQARLDEYGSKADAFSNLDENPIWLDEAKGRTIRKVRTFVKANDLHPLREENGKPKDFVFTRNNHHIALYKNEQSKYKAEAISLLEAVRRKQADEPVVQDHNLEGASLVHAFQMDRTYYFGERGVHLSPGEINPRYVFRLQKGTVNKSGGLDIYFRQQYETTLNNSHSLALRRIGSAKALPSHFLKVDRLGRVEKVIAINY